MRGYNGAITLEDIKKMGFGQMRVLLDSLNAVLEMESGVKAEDKPLSGAAAVAAMKAQFGCKKASI